MQRIGSLFFCRIDKMGVNLGGLYVCMPHQGLNRVDVYAIFKQQRGVAMASTMKGYVLLYARCFYPCFQWYGREPVP